MCMGLLLCKQIIEHATYVIVSLKGYFTTSKEHEISACAFSMLCPALLLFYDVLLSLPFPLSSPTALVQVSFPFAPFLPCLSFLGEEEIQTLNKRKEENFAQTFEVFFPLLCSEKCHPHPRNTFKRIRK